MEKEAAHQIDYGTGLKTLGTYLKGLVFCVILTLLAFWTVMSHQYSKTETLIIIFAAAVLQFFVQVIYFLRLNTETQQAKNNVLVFVFTGIILVTILLGSLWIMANLNYNMGH